MPEIVELNLELEKFISDRERLDFLENRIVKCIKETQEDVREQFNKDLEIRLKELGIDSEARPRSKKNQERMLKKEINFNKMIKQAVIEGLDNLRKDFEQNTALTDHMPEFNVLIDAVRAMYLSQLKVKHKEYRVMIGAPHLSDEEIKEQEVLTEDMTEGRALIQWYVLQNESNPEYLKNLFSTLRGFMDRLEFSKEWWGIERGLRQELGISSILKKHFKKVVPGEPKEDAHYAIDFWVETKNGNTLIFQSKSSFASLDEGIYDEKGISDLEKNLSTARPPPMIMYRKDFNGVEAKASDLVKVRKLQQDIIKAKEYARSKKGIDNAPFYLIVSRAGNYEDITGEPIPEMTRSIENTLWYIANSSKNIVGKSLQEGF